MKEKICKGCQEIKLLSDFFHNSHMKDGHLNYCSSCIRENRRSYQREYSKSRRKKESYKLYQASYMKEYMRSYSKTETGRKINRTSQAVIRAIRSGKMEKGICTECGTNKRIEAHHEDYLRPLNIEWLCSTHHALHHHPI